MNLDTYGEVINGPDTYATIALRLDEEQPVMIGWTDGHGTHFDILFVLGSKKYGSNIQGGIHPTTDLFVSIMRWGAFGFDIEHTDTAPGYYEEKLGRHRAFGVECAQAFADLINGVKQNILTL